MQQRGSSSSDILLIQFLSLNSYSYNKYVYRTERPASFKPCVKQDICCFACIS